MRDASAALGGLLMALAVTLGVSVVAMHTGQGSSPYYSDLMVFPLTMVPFLGTWPMQLILPGAFLWAGWRFWRVGVVPDDTWRVAAFLLAVGLSLYVLGWGGAVLGCYLRRPDGLCMLGGLFLSLPGLACLGAGVLMTLLAASRVLERR